MIDVVIWRGSALREWTDASLWYEKEKTGLGEEFVQEVEFTLRLARSDPGYFRIVDPPIRRALMRRFPYIILFYVRENSIVVIALHHAKRDPEVWKQRRE